MKLSRILCDRGIKLPTIPQLYLFCTVKPMCHFSPIQAMIVENRAIKMRLTTMMSIDCGTDRPMAVEYVSCLSTLMSKRVNLPKKVLGVCQFAMFKDAIAQKPK